LHSRKKRLRVLPCNPFASAFCEHSIDLTDRWDGSFSEGGKGTTDGFDGPAPDEAPDVPAVAVCAATLKVKSASETIRENAQAQTRVATRIFKGIPVSLR
jgi:hypothetical protein